MDDMPIQETEELEPVLISALEHYSYCPRQCALIHLEQAFAENLHTLRGQAVHARVDDPGYAVRTDGCARQARVAAAGGR